MYTRNKGRRSGYTKLGDVGAQTAIFFRAFDGRENNRACAHQFVVMNIKIIERPSWNALNIHSTFLHVLSNIRRSYAYSPGCARNALESSSRIPAAVAATSEATLLCADVTIIMMGLM